MSDYSEPESTPQAAVEDQPLRKEGGIPDRYKRDLALFRSVVIMASSSPELTQSLNLTLRTLLDGLGPGFASMVLLRESPHPGLVVAAHQGLWSQEAPRRVFVEKCPCDQAIEARMPIFEPDCARCTCAGMVVGSGSPLARHSRLVTPLRNRQNQVVGVLCLLCPPSFQTETLDLSLWEDVGTLMGRAVEHARLNVQLQRSRELLQTLYDVSSHLATSLDLDFVLSRVLDLSMAATEAHHGSVFLLPEPGAPAPGFCTVT